MYAIVETGGKQYRVQPGDTVAVEKLVGEPGEMLDLGQVLLVAGNGNEPRVGAPGVAGAVVRAEILAQFRGEKIIVFRYKSKVRYRRKTGHRQSLTRLRIADILLDGASSLAEAAPLAIPTVASEATAPVPGLASETLEAALIEAEEPLDAPVEFTDPPAAAEGSEAAVTPDSGETHNGS